MEVRKLTETEKRQFPNMDYCITINREDRFFSKKALFELNKKISAHLKYN